MKHQLWILNSSLVTLFVIIMLINSFLQDKPSQRKMRTMLTESADIKKSTRLLDSKRIYEHDIFGTFIKTEPRASQRSFITPMPEIKPPAIKPPKEPAKQEFIDPLKVTLKGIIFSTDDYSSIAMIADETKQEKNYRISDKIKDGQIVKIEQQKIVIVRANGQQEIVFLRKQEAEKEKPENRWKYIVKKIDPKQYHIDPKNLHAEIDSLADVIESLSLVTAYKQGNPIGIKIGKAEKNELGLAVGLQKNDVVTKINNLETALIKNRIKIYDQIVSLTQGDQITLELQRNNQNIVLQYKLAKIKKPPKTFSPISGETKKNKPGQLKQSRQQEREKREREFKRFHAMPPERKEMINSIRERILKNMKTRSRDRRVR